MNDDAEGGTGTAIAAVRHDASLLGEQDVYLFNEGSHLRLHEKLGAHLGTVDGVAGVHFAVWAPNAASVAVMGDWNGWSKSAQMLRQLIELGFELDELFDTAVGGESEFFVVDVHDWFSLMSSSGTSTSSPNFEAT